MKKKWKVARRKIRRTEDRRKKQEIHLKAHEEKYQSKPIHTETDALRFCREVHRRRRAHTRKQTRAQTRTYIRHKHAHVKNQSREARREGRERKQRKTDRARTSR